MISARGPSVSDRSNTKVEPVTSEESEKYESQVIEFLLQNSNYIFRKKISKTESKPVKETAIKEEGDSPNNLTKLSLTSDGEDEKEKKKDRELQVK